MSKLKAAVAVGLVLGFMGTGATVLTYRPAAAQGDKPPAAGDKHRTAAEGVKVPQNKEREKEAFTAWGQEVGGLQAGLGYRPGEKRTYTHGETATLVVRVRNVSKQEVTFQYLWAFFAETPPAVTDSEGKPVPQSRVSAEGFHLPKKVDLAPGTGIELYELKFKLRPANESGSKGFSTLYGTGKFSVQYERVLGNSSVGSFQPDPTVGKLATGKLDLEITPDPPAPPAPILTASEVIAKGKSLLEKEPVAVRFRVSTVDTITVTTPGGRSYQQLRLCSGARDNAARADFYVLVSPEVETTLKRIGLADLQRHFAGKVVEVQGRLHATGMHLKGSESFWFYNIQINDLAQLHAVRTADEAPGK